LWTKPVFSPDGRYIALGIPGGAAIIDVKTGKEIIPIKSNFTGSLVFSHDGKMLAVSLSGRQVGVWDTQTWQQKINIKGFGSDVGPMNFSPDGKRLVTGTVSGKVQLWDITRDYGPIIFQLGKGYADKLAFAANGKRFLIRGSDLATRAFDTANGRELFSLKGHYVEKPYVLPPVLMHALAVSDDGKTIATTGDENIRIWDAVTGKELHNIITPGKRNYVLALSQNGRMVASNACLFPSTNATRPFDDTDHFSVWDAATGRQLLKVERPDISVNRIIFLKDNRTLVTAGIYGAHLTWWDLSSGKSIRTINTRFQGVSAGGVGLSLSPDGKKLAVAYGPGEISLLDATTGQFVGTLKGHNDQVRELAFSPDGNRLLTGSLDRTARLWDLTTGQELMIFRDISTAGGAAFSPDGRSIAIAYPQGVVKVFTVIDPKSIQVAGR
jgi:WD40 repeat protein